VARRLDGAAVRRCDGAGVRRWRSHVKAALASAISRSPMLDRSGTRPLILGYHRVVNDFVDVARTEMPSMLVSTRMFERHLDCIGRRFTFVGIDEISERLASGRPFDKPVAAITFDDGYRDVYENAFPILKRKGIPAAVFVVTDLVGKPFWQVHDRLYHLVAKAYSVWQDPRRELEGMFKALNLPGDFIARQRAASKSPMLAVTSMLPELRQADVRRVMDGIEASVGNGFHDVPQTADWAELGEMQRHGIIIGSHTQSHVSLPMEAPADVHLELTESKRVIEQHLGGSCDHFAYPGGQFTPEVVDAVARAGYRFAYTACQHDDPRHPALTQERLLLWEGSSVDGDGEFSSAILDCQAHHLWPPAWRCARLHVAREPLHG
jgi:peptidoglycan/xylan/chitin deacetylase (PgdA/CDA1 family)